MRGTTLVLMAEPDYRTCANAGIIALQRWYHLATGVRSTAGTRPASPPLLGPPLLGLPLFGLPLFGLHRAGPFELPSLLS